MEPNIYQNFSGIVSKVVSDKLGSDAQLSDLLITVSDSGAKAEFDVAGSDYELDFVYNESTQQYDSNGDLNNTGSEDTSTDESTESNSTPPTAPAAPADKTTPAPKDTNNLQPNMKADMQGLQAEVATMKKAMAELISKLNPESTKAEVAPATETPDVPETEPSVKAETEDVQASNLETSSKAEPAEPPVDETPAPETTPTDSTQGEVEGTTEKAILDDTKLGSNFRRYL